MDINRAKHNNNRETRNKDRSNNCSAKISNRKYRKRREGINMELKIYENHEQKEIKWNNEELKAEIAEKVKDYKNLVYTDNQIKDAKADRARLNKLVKALEDKRKEVKKECLQPYEKFESQIKEVIAIVNEPIALIDGQVKEYEEQKKKEKQEQIEKLFEEKNIFDWLKLEKIFDTKWLNATSSIQKIESEIDEKVAKIDAEIATLQSLKEFAFEAIEEYKHSLDISRAIAEGQRLAEIQRRKEEAKKEEAAVIYTVSFKAKMTIEQSKALREFCKNNGIELLPIE